MMPGPEESIIRWGRYAAEHGLLAGTSGNLSVRVAPDRFCITASGCALGSLSPDDVLTCGLDGAWSGAPGRRPSMEAEMHRLLLERLPEAGAVFHSQPLHATLFACARLPVPTTLIPESMAYVRRVVRIPYHHPGSPELARDTADRLEVGDVGLLENHGLIVAAPSVETAVAITETFEFLCRLVYMARCADIALEVPPDAVRSGFLEHLARLRAVSR